MPMDVEIITIGDELITGHTLDTNATFMAHRLAAIGLPTTRVTSVGDSVDAIADVVQQALRRSQVVVASGGLGPTDDDLTKKAIVKVFKRNLVFHEDVLEDIRARYARRGIEMPSINQNQALLPQGAVLFQNKIGSAMGICFDEDGRIFVALPGVPAEMRQIMDDSVIPYLQKKMPGPALAVVKVRTTGIIESKLAEMIGQELKLEPGVRLAYLPSYGGVDLRVTASADSDDEASRKAGELARYLETVCGRYIYGTNSDSLESVVGQLLRDNDRTLSVAESCTGGQLGMLITSVPGSSAYFLGGIVAYSNGLKERQLGVSRQVLSEHGAVSRECADAMALGCRRLFESDYALSVTGIAGPEGGTDEKPVGTTYIGLSSKHGTYSRSFNLGTLREAVRARATYAALELLRREVLDIR